MHQVQYRGGWGHIFICVFILTTRVFFQSYKRHWKKQDINEEIHKVSASIYSYRINLIPVTFFNPKKIFRSDVIFRIEKM